MPSDDLTEVLPKTKLPPRAPINGGNTCYLDSVIVALFAEFDGWDGLLQSSHPTALCIELKAIVNDLRHGRVIQPGALNALRNTLTRTAGWHPGKGQHDAAELLAFMLDHLKAPFLPLIKNLSHHAAPDVEADHTPFTERILWLNLYSRNDNHLEHMVDDYFFSEVVHGLRRPGGSPYGVDAVVRRSLIPSYTPTRETGDTVSASRIKFGFVTLPFAISRFSTNGDCKDRRRVIVPTALSATKYIGPFTNDLQYTLILRSVVCHLGSTVRSGHYVAYTYSASGGGWRRWDDLDDGSIKTVRGNTLTGEPVNREWAEEIRQNCYLLCYELVPGEPYPIYKFPQNAVEDRRTSLDAQLAAQAQQEEDQKGASRQQRSLLSGGGASANVVGRGKSGLFYEDLRQLALSPEKSSTLPDGSRSLSPSRFPSCLDDPIGYAYDMVQKAAIAARKAGDTLTETHVSRAAAQLNETLMGKNQPRHT